jgi:hypothetical protein
MLRPTRIGADRDGHTAGPVAGSWDNSLHEAGCGDKALSPVKLDCGEINPEHLQSVAGQLTGCRYPGTAAAVNNPGTKP